MRNRLAFLAAAAAFALVMWPSTSRAFTYTIFDNTNTATALTSVTMTQLLGGYWIDESDVGIHLQIKNFGGWISVGTAPAANPNLIWVTPIGPGPGLGIKFNSAMELWANAGQVQDTSFHYTVLAPDQSPLTDIHSFMGGHAVGLAGGSIRIAEAIADQNNQAVGSLLVSDPGFIQDDQLFSPALRQILVTKDIAVIGGSKRPSWISDFDQRFTVPEPGFIQLAGLLLVGAIGVGRMRRRA